MSEIEHLVMPALRAAGRPTTYENQERMRKALTEAAHARAEAVGVRVKPLEWRPHKGDEFCFVHYDADALGGSYCIEERKTSDFDLWTPGKSKGARFDTLEAAKAAAQADYERRIISTLAHPAVPEGMVADDEMIALARRSVASGQSRSSFAQLAEWAHEEASDEAAEKEAE